MNFDAIQTGLQCPQRRLYAYEYGGTGLELARDRDTLLTLEDVRPLWRGLATHLSSYAVPPLDVIRAVVEDAVRGYRAAIAPRQDAEQDALLRALGWLLGLEVVPSLALQHPEWTVGRSGTIYGSDATGVIAYDLALVGRPTEAWIDARETDIPRQARLFSDDDHSACPLTTIALHIGDRRADRTGQIIQSTPLVYGWRALSRSGDVWAAEYETTDDYDRKHRLGSTYTRVPMWDHSIAPDTDLDPIELWLRWLDGAVRRRQVTWIGPVEARRPLVEACLADFRRINNVWRDQLQAAIPPIRTWACRDERGRPACPFIPLCFADSPEDPLACGFRLRRV